MAAPSQSQAEAHSAAVPGLFLQFLPAIRCYILSMVPDFSQADDVTRETLLVVTKKAASFEIGTSFPAWVKTIARFKALESPRSGRGSFECLSEEVKDPIGAERTEFRSETDERLALPTSLLGK